jgi:purine catabolism regulatory family protein/PucR-like helix-turn-helix protein
MAARRDLMLLRALAESPELRLRVLAGQDALERPVGGVFTTDLLDPSRYLTGGEIVLTGLMWRRRPEDSRTFVTALAAAGVAALAAGDAVLGSVPPDLVAACREHGLPLLEVPVDVSFAAITELVMRSLLAQDQPVPAAARMRRLADVARVDGLPPVRALTTLFATAGAEHGLAGWVLSATGRLVTGTPPAPGTPARAELAAACLAEPELPSVVMAGGAPFSVFGAGARGSPQGHRLAGWHVAFAGDHTGWDRERRAVAAELGSLAAGFWAGDEDRRQPFRARADALLRLLLAGGRSDAAWQSWVDGAARECGLRAGDRLVAVAVTAGPPRPRAGEPGRDPDGTRSGQAGIAAPAAVARRAGTDTRASMDTRTGTGAGAGAGPEAEGLPQAARALLEEMLPGSAAGLCAGQAVTLAPGGEAAASVAATVAVLGRVAGLDLVFGVSEPVATAEPAGGAGGHLPGGAGGHLPGGAGGHLPGGAGGHPPSGAGGHPPSGAGGHPPSGAGGHPPSGAGGHPPSGTGGHPPSGADGHELGWAGALRRAVIEARETARVAALAGPGVRAVHAAELGSCDLLLATVPEPMRRAFHDRLLGPLLAYDREHGTELVATLAAFLDCSGSWTVAAGRMYMHTNSLRYRIRRIEQLTGRSLRSLPDQAAFLLALRLAGSAEDQRGDPGGGGVVQARQLATG